MRYVPFALVGAGVVLRLLALELAPEPTVRNGLADLCLWLGLAAALLLAPPRRGVVALAIVALVAAALAFFLVGLVEETQRTHHELDFAFRPLAWLNAAQSLLLAAAGCAIAAPRLERRIAVSSFAILAVASAALFGLQYGSHQGSTWLFLSTVYWLPLLGALGVGANQR